MAKKKPKEVENEKIEVEKPDEISHDEIKKEVALENQAAAESVDYKGHPKFSKFITKKGVEND